MPILPHRRQFITHLAAGSTAVLASRCRAAAEKPRIRIGQIGTKHAHASGQMETLRRFSEVFDVVGVVENDSERRKQVEQSKTYRGLRFVTEDQLLDTEDLQAVAVETEVRELIPTASRCADRRLHLFIDKPPGDTLADFKAVTDKMDAEHRVLQMGYMLRNNPAFEFMFQITRDGWIGEVFAIHAEMSKRVGAGTRPGLAAFPGGSMFELGCHLIDPITAVLGAPRQTTPHLLRSRPEQDQLADHVVAVLDYDGANVVVRSAVNEANGFARRQFVVFGQLGTIEIRPLESNTVTLTLVEPQGDYDAGTHTIKHSGRGRYDGLWLEFAAAIRAERALPYDSTHNLAAHQTLLAACGMG